MKLPAMPVRSAQDATLNFQQLQGLLTTGEGEFTFVAATAIDKIEVSHRLGKTPKYVGITLFYAEDGHQCFASLSSVHPPTPTTFTFGVRDGSGVATSATHKYLWMAVA